MAQILNLNHFGIVQSQITPSCLSPSTSLKMKLPHLPDELLLSIVKRLHSETHISALSHTNRRLHSVLNEDLYRHNTRWGESSALYCAAMHGRVATAGMALKWGADITATPYYGWTPLLRHHTTDASRWSSYSSLRRPISQSLTTVGGRRFM